MPVALIDGDMFAYRCAASAEKDSAEVSMERVDKWLRDTLHETHCEEYRIFLGEGENFRHKLFPEYKKSRKNKTRPTFLKETREFLINDWKAESSELEADDMMGMNVSEDSIIVTNDKDMFQIPTSFYNPVKKEFHFIPESEAQYLFNLQLLMGDKSDDIPGYDGVARAVPPKFITKMLSYMENPDEDIFDVYEDKQQYLINYNLLHIWRKPSDLQIPQVLIGRGLSVPEQDLTLDLLLSILPLTNQLSGPIDPTTDGY